MNIRIDRNFKIDRLSAFGFFAESRLRHAINPILQEFLKSPFVQGYASEDIGVDLYKDTKDNVALVACLLSDLKDDAFEGVRGTYYFTYVQNPETGNMEFKEQELNKNTLAGDYADKDYVLNILKPPPRDTKGYKDFLEKNEKNVTHSYVLRLASGELRQEKPRKLMPKAFLPFCPTCKYA